MIIDELESAARALGLRVNVRDNHTLQVMRDGFRTLSFRFGDQGLIAATSPCWVPASLFHGNSEQVSLDWGMAVLLRYAGDTPGGMFAERPMAAPVAAARVVAPQGPAAVPGATSYLVPTGLLSIEELRAYRRELQQILTYEMSHLSVVTHPGNMCIRSLGPYDLGLRGWGTPPLYTEGTRARLSHFTYILPPDVCIGIFGVYNRSRGKHCTEIRLGLGQGCAVVRAVLDMTSVYGYGSSVAVLSELIVYTHNETIFVGFRADQDRPKGEHIGFLGFIAEPTGRSISIPSR